MDIGYKLFIAGVSLTIANFLYQLLTDQRWSKAAEWSFAQNIAVLLIFFLIFYAEV